MVLGAQWDLETDASIDEIRKEMSVHEVMTSKLVVANINSSVLEIAREMISQNVGSVIITDDIGPVGIITETDIISKVVINNMMPGTVMAGQIMSSPIIATKPSTNVIEAAEQMTRCNIRRLAVIDGDRIVGIITDRDILIVSPGLNTILESLIELHRDENNFVEESGIERGICQRCGAYTDLTQMNGLMICEDCKEEEGYYD
ncbi:putative signal-transduction protein containing cAMP-binding and CBS domains [Methanomethylovorans hollandica DSM 15978]|uniref:Putative signal-transduction protein containing cAMP-binding and CBS domains n=1 Tax=Methanomethylovorans hollandica (strain DSM 15978 / NBRC 107637 / DMS1) TaxID=867904 RepID=L0KYM6_METHD|nr:CBS domain-containing protein [Methanomethylovorans hollandica]AGB50562.1 putative signal-transduction protein containing cAMP-binding and CBS domains [Methanomethylovorans hollandica DSM 15978]